MKSKAAEILDILDDKYKFEESFIMNERKNFTYILHKNLDSILSKYIKDSLINKMTDDLIKNLLK